MKADKPKTRKPSKERQIDPLRKRAAALLSKRIGDVETETLSAMETRRLIHELQTHQIELEIQNEELRNAQVWLEEAKAKYADLYDFAPVGYFTFDKDGIILDANLTGASLLGVERSLLLEKPFALYISRESQDAFYLHRLKAFETGKHQACELELKRKGGGVFYAALESLAEGRLCRTAVSDITERKRAEEELQRAHEETERHATEMKARNEELRRTQMDLEAMRTEYSNLFNFAPVGYFTLDEKGNISAANITGASQLGMERASLLKRPFAHLVAGEDRPLFLAHLREVFGSIKRKECELRLLRKDRSVFFVRMESVALDEGFEGGVRCLTAVSDITERKRMEEALRENERRLMLAQQAARIGTFEWNIQTGVNTWTPELEAMYGLKPGQFGATQPEWEQLVHPEDRAEAVRLVNQAFETGNPEEGEWRVIWPDGSVHWLFGRWQVLKDTAGKPLRMTGVNIDITERKRAEEALLKAYQKTNTILESISDGFFVLDQEWRYTYVNKAAEGLLRRKREELLGHIIWDIFPQARGLLFEKESLRAVAGNVPVHFEEFYPEPLNLWYEAHCYPSPDGLSVYFSDVTVRKKAEETLKRAKEDLEVRVKERTADLARVNEELEAEIAERGRAEEETMKLNQELEQRVRVRTAELESVNRDLEAFSYTVSHDLRAPLRSIEGFARAVLEDYTERLDDTGKDYLHRVHAASQRMSQLIEALLTMARLTGRELAERNVNLSDAATVIAYELKKGQPQRQVEFVIAEGMIARGDPQMLQIVLENLLSNAWKFTGRHSSAKIEFGITRVDEKDVYFVRDDGAGFDMNHADKLLVPFQRLHKDDEFPGLGIGLPIVHRIITRHGGKIWAEGAPEKGATFYFTL